jgi:polyhydroxyalkanoate synthase subunit PhaC
MNEDSSSRWMQSLGAVPTPGSVNEGLQAWIQALTQDPSKLAALQQHFIDEQQRLLGTIVSPEGQIAVANGAALPSTHDKRFAGEAWQSSPQFRYLAESYLSTYRLLLESVDGLDVANDTRKKIRFFVKQYLDAMSPSNFLVTNPEALQSAIESKGETLKAGLENLQEDMEKGHISMTDEHAFRVGENLAITPGSVVFENEIFQLVQYAPLTNKVHLRPLLIVPPCINKFYILDLRPDNSFVRYAVEQGFTVFIVSWRNVQAGQGHLTWDDYIADGVVKAIDNVRRITNVEKINALGFCVGGTLLASAIAVLRRMGDEVIESVTFLTTFIDFSDAGEVTSYINEEFIANREREIGQGGIVSGSELAYAFTSLRANELIWNYVVGNYLKGTKPPAFDLLFWNSDSTNLPGPWYAYYLRNMYSQNNLAKPDKLVMCGVPVDVSYVNMPAFVFAAKEDHIVPWRTAYRSGSLLGGKSEFVLGAAGHVAGVINPASKNKRSYRVGASASATADDWLATSTEVEGSWWPRWAAWLKPYSGTMVPARFDLGNADFKTIEPAPGRYVKEKS